MRVKRNKTLILCNECYKPLTDYELQDYPILWRFSGDMYCSKHKKRAWEVHKHKRRIKVGIPL